MTIEELSLENIKDLTDLVLNLWTDCTFDNEYNNYKNIIDSENEICYLAKEQESYIAFIHLTVRNDYVEGATNLPVAYIEGIYVKSSYQMQGVAKKLISVAEDWAKRKGLKQIASDTEVANSASIKFHTKVGFSETERIVCFIKDL